MDKRVCFVALIIPSPVDVECHVTIGVAKDVTEHESRLMQQELERKIRPHLPIQMEICNYRLRGNDNTIPTYDVSFPDATIEALLKKYYRTHFKGDPSKRQYPLLEPHVTVDTPERLAHIESLIRGPNKGCITIHDTTFQVRNEGGEAVFDQEKWKCNSCARFNPIGQKECTSPGCSQWRPQEAMPKRPGDWECCGTVIFASRTSCFKCGKSNQAASAPSIYEVSPLASGGGGGGGGNFRKIRYPDWRCCGDLVFGSKPNCWKCGRARPN